MILSYFHPPLDLTTNTSKILLNVKRVHIQRLYTEGNPPDMLGSCEYDE
jgi:hypothetical protein